MSTVWIASHSRPQQHLLASLRDCIMSPTDPQQIILASLAQHHSPLMQCLLCRSQDRNIEALDKHADLGERPMISKNQQAHMSTVWMAAHSRPPQHLLASLRDCIMSPTDPQQIILASLAQHHSPLMHSLL